MRIAVVADADGLYAVCCDVFGFLLGAAYYWGYVLEGSDEALRTVWNDVADIVVVVGYRLERPCSAIELAHQGDVEVAGPGDSHCREGFLWNRGHEDGYCFTLYSL